jgi:hypothetical protein
LFFLRRRSRLRSFGALRYWLASPRLMLHPSDLCGLSPKVMLCRRTMTGRRLWTWRRQIYGWSLRGCPKARNTFFGQSSESMIRRCRRWSSSS